MQNKYNKRVEEFVLFKELKDYIQVRDFYLINGARDVPRSQGGFVSQQ
jgi:hypothetical protein